MKFGETLASPQLRIYLTGQVRIEAGWRLEEVGVKPSPEIEALYVSLVRQTSPASP